MRSLPESRGGKRRGCLGAAIWRPPALHRSAASGSMTRWNLGSSYQSCFVRQPAQKRSHIETLKSPQGLALSASAFLALYQIRNQLYRLHQGCFTDTARPLYTTVRSGVSTTPSPAPWLRATRTIWNLISLGIPVYCPARSPMLSVLSASDHLIGMIM